MVWWDQDKRIWFRWCQACVVAARWGVQRQVCLAYSQAWWWECHGLGLHECCQYWGATVHWRNHECQHVLWHIEAEHDPLPSETGPQGSIPTWQRPQTHLQEYHCPAKEAEGKGDGLAEQVSRPKPYWASVGHPQMAGGGAQSTSSGMPSWRNGRGLQWQPVKLWWTPCPRRLRQCWKIMVATQNIDILGPVWTFSLWDVLTFVASGLDIIGCVLSYFEGTANLHCYTSCTLTTLHCRKMSFFSDVTWKDIINVNKNVRGVLTSVRYCVYIYIYIYTQLFLSCNNLHK